MTEATALQRLRRGKEDALAFFIDKYTAYVCTVIRCIIGASMTEADVEEVASDVFLELWRQSDHVSAVSVRPWLGGVARNKAKQKLRQRGVTLSLDEDLIAMDDADPYKNLEQAEQEQLVRAAVFSALLFATKLFSARPECGFHSPGRCRDGQGGDCG